MSINIIKVMLLVVGVALLITAYKVKEDVAIPKVYLTPEQMQEDIDFLVDKIRKVHPMFKDYEPPNFAPAIETALLQAGEPKTIEDFYFIVNSIVTPLNDGHTSVVYYDYDKYYEAFLPMNYYYDGVYIDCDYNDLLVGDKLLTIGGKTVPELMDLLDSVYSNENRYSLHSMFNYFISKGIYLKHFDLVNDNNEVEYEFLRNSEIIKVNVPLKIVKKVPNVSKENDWIKWSIDKEKDIGYLRLDKSKYDGYFRLNLKKFFSEVAKQKINNVVIDLRKCRGGGSYGMEYEIGYLDGVERFTSFGYKTRVGGYEPYAKRVEKINKELKFGGEVFMLSSSINFSASNITLIHWQDNGFATLVGEPSGNKPDSYTEISGQIYYLKNSNIRFHLPKCYTLRPDRSKKDDIAVFPDYEVYTTIEDVKQGRDPQMEKVYDLIEERAKKG